VGVRADLLPVISQDKVTIDKAMLPALYQPFRKEREHPYGRSLRILEPLKNISFKTIFNISYTYHNMT
jgi:hypothetical protein